MNEIAEERKELEMYRISLVRMYYSLPQYKTTKTPEPFMEFRVFAYKDKEPRGIEKDMIKKEFSDILTRLEIIFPSLVYAKTQGKIEKEEKSEETTIVAKEKKGEIIMEIDGYEIEDVDKDEVERFFKRTLSRINLNQIYRYVAFFNPDGSIKIDYDEFDIRRLERNIERALREEMEE